MLRFEPLAAAPAQLCGCHIWQFPLFYVLVFVVIAIAIVSAIIVEAKVNFIRHFSRLNKN